MQNGVLEILAIGDRFSAAYKSIESTLRELGEISFREESFFAKANDAVDYVRNSSIDLVLMPNPYGNERRRWIYKHLRALDFPVLVFDRGALPGSWFFDLGFNADSATYHPLNWDKPLSAGQTLAIDTYIADAKTQQPLESQRPAIGAEALRQALGLVGRKVLFVPFQRPSDSTVKFFSGAIGSYENFIDLVNQTQRILAEHAPEWTIVAKKHPLETVRPAANVLFVADDTHVHDLIEMSDTVLLINSGVGVISALFHKPVLHAGTAFYAHPGMNRSVSTPQDILYWLTRGFDVSIPTIRRFIHHLVNTVYSFGTFKTERCLQKDGAYRNITRHIDFTHIALPANLKKKSVLFISPVIPVPINRGSAHRTDQIIRALLDCQVHVKLLILNQSEGQTPSSHIKRRLELHYNNPCLQVEVRRHPGHVQGGKSRRAISRYTQRLLGALDKLLYRDAMINNRLALPSNFEKLILKELGSGHHDLAWFNYLKVLPTRLPKTTTRIVTDLHDLQSARIKADVLPSIGKSRRDRYLRTFMRSEKRLLDNCDLALAISPVEQKEIENLYRPSTRLLTLKASDDPRYRLSRPEHHLYDIAFIGSNSAPNANGLVWFIQCVLPLLGKTSPDLKFLVQGNINRNRVVKSAITDSPFAGTVHSQGFVESLDDVYASAKVMICPIRHGTGMKIKVVEAMAYGKAIVGTPVAFEGIDTTTGLIAEETAEGFASQILALIGNPQQREAQEQIAVQVFTAQHAYKAMKKIINDSILNGPLFDTPLSDKRKS